MIGKCMPGKREAVLLAISVLLLTYSTSATDYTTVSGAPKPLLTAEPTGRLRTPVPR